MPIEIDDNRQIGTRCGVYAQLKRKRREFGPLGFVLVQPFHYDECFRQLLDDGVSHEYFALPRIARMSRACVQLGNHKF